MNMKLLKTALMASVALLMPTIGWAAESYSASSESSGPAISSNSSSRTDEILVAHRNAAALDPPSDVIAKESVQPPVRPRSPPGKGVNSAQAIAAAKPNSAITCDDLKAKKDSITGFNSRLEYVCAFEGFRDYSIVLTDKNKMDEFLAAWAPEKWLDSDFLKMDGVSDKDRMLRTFILISRMRDFTHERFDFVESPKEKSESDRTIKAPTIKGGIGAVITLNNEWQLEKAIFDGAPKEGLSQEAFKAKRKALFVIGPGHELTVSASMPHSPAQGVLKEGDIISAVGDTTLAGMDEEAAINLIKGDAGTPVTLHVLRRRAGGDMASLTFNLVRAVTNVSAVITHDKEGVRYIELDNFTNDNLLSDFYDALKGAHDKSMKGVVISVRGNPGGRVDYVLAMLDMIIPRGLALRAAERVSGSSDKQETEYVLQDGYGLITEKEAGQPDSAKTIEAAERVPFTAQYAAAAIHNPQYVYKHPLMTVIDQHMPVSVIVNVGSYSASEVFAGALQATARASIVGEPSAGKGAIMVDMPLPAGGSLLVTFGEFFPGGIKNKGPGILPDYQVAASDDFGETDAQRDKATALVEAARNDLEQRAALAAQRTKINGDRFEEDMKRRDEFDMKSPQEQERLMSQ